MKLLLLIVIFAPLAGCWSQARSETSRMERITFDATVPIPTAEGVKVLPIHGTLRRVVSESAETRSGPDTEAISAVVAQGLSVLTAGVALGFPWTQVVGGVGAALTAATTGYLALKKREQMKLPAKG